MKQYLMPSYGEIMKHALTCKAIGAEVCSSVWCEFVLVKVNMNQLGVILYLNMYVCKFEPIQHVFRQKAFCKESILFHSYTLFYSLQRGQGIFIAINYTHVFSGDPNKDPKGYNSPYEQVGEHYRSIRYDIIENKNYPHLTNDEIYRRLKELAAPISAEGVKIAMILNIAIKHRLLLKKPQGKSLVRELGMTCTNAAVINIIASPDEHFYIDEWGREMEAKLLKQ